MKRSLLFILLMAVAGVALFFTGCDSRSVKVPDYYLTYLGTDIDTIYADGNTETYATITAAVKDKDNVPVTDQVVTFTSNIGQITKEVATDASGTAISEFHDLGMLGPVVIAAKIANSVKTITLYIDEAPTVYISKLVSTQESIYSDNDTGTTTEIKATVRDSKGNLLTDEIVTFNTDLGEITSSATSNANGVAIATFDDAGDLGDATITASIGGMTKTLVVPIEAPPSYRIVSLTATPEVIYADNNLTYSTVRAVIRDDENYAVPGETVRFRVVPDNQGNSIGNLEYSASTDSSGVASVLFWDNEEVGTAIIEAKVGTTTAQVTVQVDPVPVVQSVTFDMSFTDMNIDQVRTIRAIALDENNNRVEDGTIITFETEKGFFQSGTDTATEDGTQVMVATSNGAAVAYFNAGDQSGENNLTAFIGEVGDIYTFPIFPGNPSYMVMTTEQDTIQVNSSEEIWVRAAVKDRYGNAVTEGRAVTFETTIGSITSPNFTNDEGIAQASFSSGLSAGLAEIKAVADSANGSCVVNVISDDVHSLTYAFDGQVDIDIINTGGVVSRELIVNLWDMSGNPVLDSKDISFTFVYTPPLGCNINEEAWAVGEVVTVTSVNGSAIVSINSGSAAGVVTVKAYTTNESGQEVSVTRSNIVIHAGPPYHASVGIGEYNTGENTGAGTWTVGINAIITDEWGNPVDYGTAVWFSIPDNTIDWATVVAEAYVGNPNEEGDSLQGVAFSTLTYDGSHTFDVLPIQINCGNLVDVDYVDLPLNGPQLEMLPVPGHLDWTPTNNPQYLTGNVLISVTDDQGNPISGAKVTLYSVRGEFVEADDPYNVEGEEPWVVQTVDGIAYAKIRFSQLECPAVIPPPNEVPVDITGTIVGTEVTDQTTITLLNYN